MNHINLFLPGHKDLTQEAQINMLLFKTYLFMTHGKILENSIRTNIRTV